MSYIGWFLVILAVFSVFTYLGRLVAFRRAQVDYQDFIKGVSNVLERGNDEEAISVCEDTMAPVGRIVATAIRHRHGSARILKESVDSQGRAEISRLDRRLAVLAIIAQTAPLFGLVGTILGFMSTVNAANFATTVLRTDLLAGVSRSLLDAALGLGVAALASILYGELRVRLERTIVDLEAAATQIVGYLSSLREKEMTK